MILVTGGTGFVGPKVVRALRDEGRDVRCLVRNVGTQPARRLVSWGCELARGDITDYESLRAAAEGCDTVVHLVAIITGRPQQFEQVMAEGTRKLVSAAEAAKARRFVLMSALGTSDETKDLVPYYRAKWEMERAVSAGGFEHVIFRPSFVFGRDGGVLPTFLRLARLTPATPIVGSGTQRIQPIWVDDVAVYFAKAVDLPEAKDRTFELGGPDVVDWNEFWERLKRVAGIRRPSFHVPMTLMRLQAPFLERLPRPPVTRDQLTMLAAGDNVVSDDAAVRAFELALVPLDEQIRRAA